MELVAGSYEQVLFGFTVHPDRKANGDPEQKWTSVADFTHHAHTASLSAVAVNNRFVVTGSKDETIHIYDMKKKTEHGALVHHNGTITCLKFYGSRHLISGAEDGLICVWDTKKWECLKSIRAHKGHVTFLSIHPSGKLALSVGTDKTLSSQPPAVLIPGRGRRKADGLFQDGSAHSDLCSHLCPRSCPSCEPQETVGFPGNGLAGESF